MSTTRKRILVTRVLPEPVMALARERFDVSVWPHDRPIGNELATWATGSQALLVMTTDRIDRSVLEPLCPQLRAIATYSVGHEHLDLVAAEALNLPVFHTPDVLSDAVAEVALLLMLAACRDARAAEDVLRNGQWGPWSPTRFLGRELKGRRLGIFGLGRIGRAIADRAAGFGLQIHYHNRSALERADGWRYHDSVESLLSISDIFCVAVPSTELTRGILNPQRLELLPRGAVFVNIARGDIVDEGALIDAIQSGRIGAAGLDVFCNEPGIDSRFRTLPRTTLLPHIGSASEEARVEMGRLAVEALDSWLNHGRVPANCLNPHVASGILAGMRRLGTS